MKQQPKIAATTDSTALHISLLQIDTSPTGYLAQLRTHTVYRFAQSNTDPGAVVLISENRLTQHRQSLCAAKVQTDIA